MDFRESTPRKRLLYADLFKPKLQEEDKTVISSSGNGSGWDSGEVEDGDDSVAESMRRMAEAMLLDEEQIEVYDAKGVSQIAKNHISVNNRYSRINRSEMKIQSGSGMQAIFLGSSENGNGTGVFLPRVNYEDPIKKKPGCSTVLVPTRVLQVLEFHFNNRLSSSATSSLSRNRANPDGEGGRSRSNEASEVVQLPQEWTY